MSEFHERRKVPRFKIPEAKIILTQEAGFQGSEAITDEGMMDDCSVKGMRIQTEKAFKPGAKAQVQLLIPGKKTLQLIGHIIWTSQSPDVNLMLSVVEFSPFGEGEDQNSLTVREDLTKIAEEYLY
ncbi:MAG: hypothetical protein GF313_17075 [Caldithrix sp.]|nr:hypothetical protein [Caldithrix sp.]